MSITVEEAAARLDNSQYRAEGNGHPGLFGAMKAAGLVAVFGASDDLMEFEGAIRDEIGCYNGGTAYLDKDGLLENDCHNGDCPYHAAAAKEAGERGASITAVWCPDGVAGAPSWIYETTIPHAIFRVMEDDQLYCIGIVFRLADVP